MDTVDPKDSPTWAHLGSLPSTHIYLVPRVCQAQRGEGDSPQRLVNPEAGLRPKGVESRSRASRPQHTHSSLPQFSIMAEGIP